MRITVSLVLISLFAIAGCGKNDPPELAEAGEKKYIQRIETYQPRDFEAAALSIIVFEYDVNKRVSRTTSTANNGLETVYTYTYSGDKVIAVEETGTGSYKRTDRYEYAENRVIGRESVFNNGNPDSYLRYTFEPEENAYRIGHGIYPDYVYFNDQGDPVSSSFTLLTYTYDQTKKGIWHAYKDAPNFPMIWALRSGWGSIHPVVETEYMHSNVKTTYTNTYDKDGYLIESVATGGPNNSSNSRRVYHYEE